MKIKSLGKLVLLAAVLLFAQVSGGMTARKSTLSDEEVPRMIVDDLKVRLNDPSLVIIDV